MAVPGGICVSDSVVQQVQDKIDARFDDAGEQNLKNLERPVRVYRVVPGADSSKGDDNLLRMSRFSNIVGPKTKDAVADVFVRSEPPSIMILPFKNLSGSADQVDLVDGFRLAIQSALVKLSGLFLINAPASEHYRHSNVSAIQAGNEVGVRYVLEGAVQMSGERLRITIQLTDAPAAQIIWAEKYDRVVDDIFEVQDEITTEVAVALEIELLAGEDGLIWWNNLPNRTARELVLRGISHLYMGSENGNEIARSIFQELHEILPDSSQALGLLALTNWLEVMRGWSMDDAQSIECASTQAEKAIELGDADGLGRVVLGSVRLFQRKHDEALALAEDATLIRASCPVARAVYSNVLHFTGDNSRAIKNIKDAVKRARIYPPWMATVLSASYRDNGQIEPSISVANECLRIDPENLDAHILLCSNYVLSNSVDDARRVAEEVLRLQPTFSISAYVETQPYKNRKTLEDVVGTLHEAGLPE